ncbi:MAG: AAA family ATPase [Candidatus Levybacteria bacterium]|nr:AAA family ATPase [Candidatus Levybacteria bacterium]
MRVLIFGSSGSGKTYVSTELRKLGINAVDADSVEGLSSWFDGSGNKMPYKEDADEEFLNNHSFLWDRKFLEEYLKENPNIYLFGASGNIFGMLDLFDKVYFLKVNPGLQKERLVHQSRENPMGNTEYQRENAVRWGRELEKKAKALGIGFIDATLTPEEIFKLIR